MASVCQVSTPPLTSAILFSKKLGLWNFSFSLLYHSCRGKFEDVSDEIEESANIDIKDSVLRILGVSSRSLALPRDAKSRFDAKVASLR